MEPQRVQHGQTFISVNGGVLTNAGSVAISATGGANFSNVVQVLNGGKLFSGNVSVGAFDANGVYGNGLNNGNLYSVGGGAAMVTVSNGTIVLGGVGYSTLSAFNTMTVTNAQLQSGALTVGNGASNNTVSVSSNVTWNLITGNITIGGGTGNWLTIDSGVLTKRGRGRHRAPTARSTTA